MLLFIPDHLVEEEAHAHVQNFINTDYSDREVAVLVSDLRGFTSTTRKYGIVHFASIIVRMRQLVLPIFAKTIGLYRMRLATKR